MSVLISFPAFILLAILAIVSFFFSASETSLISVNKIRIRNLVNKGIKKANLVLSLIAQLDRVVAAILIGNNLVNIAISSLLTVMLVSIYGEGLGIILAIFCAAVFLLVVCEIMPKTLAIRYSERVALFTSPFLAIFIKLFLPIVNLFTLFTNFILSIFGAHIEKRSPLISEEELRLMIEVGKEEGVLSDEERKMLHKIFEFGDTKVGEVMVPEEKIVAIDKSSGAEKLLDVLVEEGHARIPVYEGARNNIIGIIYARDLLYIWRNRGLVVMADLIHPAYYVNFDKRVNELLREFQLKRIQIAIVVDDNKKTLGMVTLEDLLEEIVGEIEERFE